MGTGSQLNDARVNQLLVDDALPSRFGRGLPTRRLNEVVRHNRSSRSGLDPICNRTTRSAAALPMGPLEPGISYNNVDIYDSPSKNGRCRMQQPLLQD
jgi:hypothetical protein